MYISKNGTFFLNVKMLSDDSEWGSVPDTYTYTWKPVNLTIKL